MTPNDEASVGGTEASGKEPGKNSKAQSKTIVPVVGGLLTEHADDSLSWNTGAYRALITRFHASLTRLQVRNGKLDGSAAFEKNCLRVLQELYLPISWLADQLLLAGVSAGAVNRFMYGLLKKWHGEDHATDLGNARRLVALHGHELRHCAALGWLAWDGTRWRVDDRARAMGFAKEVHETWKQDGFVVLATLVFAQSEKEEIAIQGRAFNLFGCAKRFQSAARLDAMLKLAQSEPRVLVTIDDLDAEPWFFNVANGTIDLRTGKLRPHNRHDLITRISPVPYVPGATHPLWDRFLNETTGGDTELRGYVQRAAGSSLVGRNDDEIMNFVFGPGGSGKSTFVEAVRATVGDYAATLDFESLLKKNGGSGIRNDIARLRGTRFVTSIEVDDGRELAQGLVKTITGGDTISARFLYKEFFEFTPSFTLWLVANHPPGFDADDDAMNRRIKVIPFPYGRDEANRDAKVKTRLKDTNISGHAILAWLVDGCVAWHKNGLGTCAAVDVATKAYREEMDVIAHFIEDCCDVGLGYTVTSAHLYERYSEWARTNGHLPVLTGTMFGRRLTTKKRYAKTKVNGQRGWRGLKIRPVGWGGTGSPTSPAVPALTAGPSVE
jgi:putative DNA primase/helicase